ncbi:gamma-F420-2:alpha-L-glutamate ligase [Evansella caseinilytica]|uniref:Gamma-F420-2:alpha-L-glutamate ligase n=1 Tax=Evansella caseinilytica TaxID=1503961 RepID=A0A1H3PU55_9BACI|nr:RimK family alpha-L-glutamate ligase [Evansella caseinilytica]SDZ04478.1 gamma-F420-2:alpha-L-glutamate ligase [Evansella caseinilytica]
MKYNGWLIYNAEDAQRNEAFIRWMKTEAAALGIELTFLLKEHLLYGVTGGALFISHRGKHIQLPDFVIMRNIDPLFGRQLEAMGVRVMNTSSLSEIANNKARTHQLLAQANVPMIDTLFVKRNEFSPAVLPYTYPVVVKEVDGRSGKQVYAAATEQELTALLEHVRSNELIIQKMGDVPGKDVRVFVIGNNIVAAVLRFSSTDFKANFSLGGSAQIYPLSAEETKLVHRIIRLFPDGLDFVGIDFLFAKDGSLLFNEIEDVAGSRTLSANTSINTVRLYLEYVLTALHAKN